MSIYIILNAYLQYLKIYNGSAHLEMVSRKNLWNLNEPVILG